MSIFSDITYYGNWVISVAGFIYWAYQITRSFIKYWKHEDGGAFDIVMLHLLLFVANFLYLLYEVNVTFTPIYFTMLLFTDITGVWCFLLISQNDGDKKSMMSSKSSWFIDFMIFCLILIYIGAYFMPKHYGIQCTDESSPLGSLVLCIFYMVWTFYVVYTIKNDPLLKLKEESRKSLYETTKRLSIHEFEGEYDHGNMVLAQRQMFMITTVINLIIQVLLITWQILTSVLGFTFDDAVKSACKDGWHFQDSNVSMLLNCFMISMPIQQFTSCFYVIPMEHKFFESKDAMVKNSIITAIEDKIAGNDEEIEMKDNAAKNLEEIEGEKLDGSDKGDDENQNAAAQAPVVGQAGEDMAFDKGAKKEVEDKQEVRVVPQNLISEQLGTEDSVGEIEHSEHSDHGQKENIRSTKDLRK